MALRAFQHRRWEKIARDRRRPTVGKLVIVARSNGADAVTESSKPENIRAREAMTNTDAVGDQTRNKS